LHHVGGWPSKWLILLFAHEISQGLKSILSTFEVGRSLIKNGFLTQDFLVLFIDHGQVPVVFNAFEGHAGLGVKKASERVFL